MASILLKLLQSNETERSFTQMTSTSKEAIRKLAFTADGFLTASLD